MQNKAMLLRDLPERQHTIAAAALCEGIGVHKGALARLRLAPAPADSGISFVRSDFGGADARIPARIDFVSAVDLGTSLRNAHGAEISTVEHLLAACAGLGVDNLHVEIDGPELPILDGSSAPFVDVLLGAGLKAQAAPRRRLRVLETVEVVAGAKRAALSPLRPGEAPSMDVTIRFADPAIGVQQRVFTPGREAFLNEIADARTFGFMADVEKMHAAGLGRGASLENAIVVDQGRVINPEGLRHEDEFVRHKILDALGDLSLAGGAILGRYVADQPGHALNTALVRRLMDSPHAWAWEDAPGAAPEAAHAAGIVAVAAAG
jgi:UDP-3-O-[3-hydroxymyristoyl] N-acetylglucosamine deacetylase